MTAKSSPDSSFQGESSIKEPSTPRVNPNAPKSSSLSTPGTAKLGEHTQGTAKFNLFEDTKTPLQRSTNSLNQNVSTAPPFMRSTNENSMNAIPADLVDINLAIGALDLDFGTAARSKENKDLKEKDANSNEELSVEGAERSNEQLNQGPQFGNGLVLPPHHQQPFHPFFPINGFGHPLPGSFTPGEPLNGSHHQPWPTKAGHVPFSNHIGERSGLEGLSHTPPLPNHPGMIPFRPFEFGPDGMVTPPPHLSGPPEQGHNGLVRDVNFSGLTEIKDGRVEFHHPSNPPGFFNGAENQLGNFDHQQAALQNSRLWPALNGGPQEFSENYGMNGILPPNGLRQNNGQNDRRVPYYQNGGANLHNHHNHHHHHHNSNSNNNSYNNRRFGSNGGHRRRGEDASRFANAKLNDFIGQIYSLCKDQHGCRFLQKQLESEENAASIIFDEIQTHVIELMMDSFGNYLIQKLLENVNDEQRLILVQNASPEFVSIALDPHGTRALQKLVECIDSEKEAHIVVQSLSSEVVLLSRDLNGNHVIQKCLQRFTHQDSQFIFDTAIENCLNIATHRHGCCVLQRCLDHGSDEQCEKLSLAVSEIAAQLSYDPFGNYVVQYVLAKNNDAAVSRIVEAIKSDIVGLALHKFGSNVIEKCLRTTKYSEDLINTLLEKQDDLVKLLNDPFGNYVLQTSLDVAKSKQFDTMSSLLRPLLPQIRNTPHGRRISARLQHTE